MHKQRLFIVIAASVGIIAAFFPWVSIFIFSFSGISSEAGSGGLITLALFGAAGGIAIATGDRANELEAKMKKSVAGIGAAVFGYLLYYMFIRAEGMLSAMGTGVWLTLIAGLVVLALPFIVKGDGTFEMPTKDTINEDLGKTSSGDSGSSDSGSSAAGAGATVAAAASTESASSSTESADASSEEE